MRPTPTPATTVIAGAALFLVPAANAQLGAPPASYIEPTGPDACTEYADGSARTYDTKAIWRQMCSGTPNVLSADDLQTIAADHHRQMAGRDSIVVIDTPRDSGPRSAGLNIVFNINPTNAPAGFATAFAIAEHYIESKFTNPITVTIDISWAALPAGVLGATASNFVSNVSYTSSRAGLVAGMDSDDIIQNFLPLGSTVPVRFTALSGAVSNVSTIDWTRANFRATVGAVAGPDCSMQFSTNFAFDLDPTSGVAVNQVSLVDVVIHEVGHCLGFVSAADLASPTDIRALDLFRFARADRPGIGNTNPDSLANFQTAAREVDFDSPGNDDANTDLISAEFRMSDGNPFQASHFFQQSANPALAIGIMQPALANGVSFGPDFFRPADLAVFDAIGWSIAGGSCPADADHDGQVNPADVAFFINTWFNALAQGTTAGDFNNSGQVDPADVAAFIAAWLSAVSNGC